MANPSVGVVADTRVGPPGRASAVIERHTATYFSARPMPPTAGKLRLWVSAAWRKGSFISPFYPVLTLIVRNDANRRDATFGYTESVDGITGRRHSSGPREPPRPDGSRVSEARYRHPPLRVGRSAPTAAGHRIEDNDRRPARSSNGSVPACLSGMPAIRSWRLGRERRCRASPTLGSCWSQFWKSPQANWFRPPRAHEGIGWYPAALGCRRLQRSISPTPRSRGRQVFAAA